MAGARQSAGEDIRGRIRYLGWHKEGPPMSIDRSIQSGSLFLSHCPTDTLTCVWTERSRTRPKQRGSADMTTTAADTTQITEEQFEGDVRTFLDAHLPRRTGETFVWG